MIFLRVGGPHGGGGGVIRIRGRWRGMCHMSILKETIISHVPIAYSSQIACRI